MNPVHQRDGGKCVVTGGPAETVHHRVHGNRSDMRPANLLSVSGSGVTVGHGWIEAHPAAAATRGWTVSKHDPRDLTDIPVWMENGPLGRGWYLLDNEYGFTGWPGSLSMQARALPDPPPLEDEETRHG